MRFKDKIKSDNRDDYFQALAMIESSGNPNAQARTSSAAGLYQFTRGTWNAIVEKMGLNYTENDRFDPEKSRLIVERLTQDNERYLQNSLDREIRPNELYISHFLGMGGARKLLTTYEENPNTKVSEVLSKQAINANKNVFYNKDGSLKNVREFYKWSQDKIRQYMPQEPEYDFYNDPEQLFTEENTIENRESQRMSPQPEPVLDIPQEELYPLVHTQPQESTEETPQVKEAKTNLDQKQKGFIQKLMKATEVQYIDPNETEETTYGHTPQYQQGGYIPPTELTEEEEQEFLKWYGQEPEQPHYDWRGFFKTEKQNKTLKPRLNNYYEDENFHAYSIGYDGRILKSPAHPTYNKTIEAEKELGNKIEFINGRYFINIQ